MHRKNVVLYIILAMILSCALIMGGCEKQPPVTDEPSGGGTIDENLEPYVIGGVFSVTGRASFLGDPEKKSMEMFADMINENGGINGHRLEVIIYDDEGDPTNTVINVKKLIEKDRDYRHRRGKGSPPHFMCRQHQDHISGKALGIQDAPDGRACR